MATCRLARAQFGLVELCRRLSSNLFTHLGPQAETPVHCEQRALSPTRRLKRA